MSNLRSQSGIAFLPPSSIGALPLNMMGEADLIRQASVFSASLLEPGCEPPILRTGSRAVSDVLKRQSFCHVESGHLDCSTTFSNFMDNLRIQWEALRNKKYRDHYAKSVKRYRDIQYALFDPARKRLYALPSLPFEQPTNASSQASRFFQRAPQAFTQNYAFRAYTRFDLEQLGLWNLETPTFVITQRYCIVADADHPGNSSPELAHKDTFCMNGKTFLFDYFTIRNFGFENTNSGHTLAFNDDGSYDSLKAGQSLHNEDLEEIARARPTGNGVLFVANEDVIHGSEIFTPINPEKECVRYFSAQNYISDPEKVALLINACPIAQQFLETGEIPPVDPIDFLDHGIDLFEAACGKANQETMLAMVNFCRGLK